VQEVSVGLKGKIEKEERLTESISTYKEFKGEYFQYTHSSSMIMLLRMYNNVLK
jgi:hypothetical protein